MRSKAVSLSENVFDVIVQNCMMAVDMFLLQSCSERFCIALFCTGAMFGDVEFVRYLLNHCGINNGNCVLDLFLCCVYVHVCVYICVCEYIVIVGVCRRMPNFALNCVFSNVYLEKHNTPFKIT